MLSRDFFVCSISTHHPFSWDFVEEFDNFDQIALACASVGHRSRSETHQFGVVSAQGSRVVCPTVLDRKWLVQSFSPPSFFHHSINTGFEQIKSLGLVQEGWCPEAQKLEKHELIEMRRIATLVRRATLGGFALSLYEIHQLRW